MTRRHFLPLFVTPVLSGCLRSPAEREWRGVLFNSPVSIRYRASRELPASVFSRIRVLEKIFSLYEPESELSLLNQQGKSASPSFEMLTLLKRCQSFHQVSRGTFEPTIQTYWNWLSARNQSGRVPDQKERQAKLAEVDFSRVKIATNGIELNGTQLTLNAVVQGFITDQISLYLQEIGVESALVNLGEFRAFGDSYPVAIRHYSSSRQILKTVQLEKQALAVSSGSGHRLNATGYDNHLLSPTSGQSPPARNTVAILAPDATTADAWATILAINPGLSVARPENVKPVDF